MVEQSAMEKAIAKLNLLGVKIVEHNDFVICYKAISGEPRLMHLPTNGKCKEYSGFGRFGLSRHFAIIGDEDLKSRIIYNNPQLFVASKSGSVIDSYLYGWSIEHLMVNLERDSMIRNHAEMISHRCKGGPLSVTNKEGQTFDIGKYLLDKLGLPYLGDKYNIGYFTPGQPGIEYILQITLKPELIEKLSLELASSKLYVYMDLDFKPCSIKDKDGEDLKI